MAISIRLSGEELAETRFAFSPIWELGMSLYKPMRDPAKHALHLPWVQEDPEGDRGPRPGPAVRGGATRWAPGPNVHAYIPDFLTPPPETPFPEFEEELETRGLDTDPSRCAASWKHRSESLQGVIRSPR